MVNTLRPDKALYVYLMVRAGYSTRKICALAGIAKNTALAHINQHIDAAPTCDHGKKVYRCLTCTAGRNSPTPHRNQKEAA